MKLGCSLAALILAAGGAWAQTVPPQAAQMRTTLEKLAEPGEKEADREIYLPEIEDDSIKSSVAGGKLPLRLENVQLIDGAGNPVVDEQLVAIYRKYLGETITVDGLFDIRNRLQTYFRDQGFFLTRVILEQGRLDVDKAIPTIRIVRGEIKKVFIKGEAGAVEGLIRSIAERLQTGNPVTLAEVERCLLLIQDIPGIAVRARFGPAQQGMGSNLTLDVVRTPFAGYASVDNRGPGYAGPWQFTLALAAHSHTALGERVEAYLFSTPSNEQRFGQLAVTAHLNNDGLTLRGFGGYSPSYPGGLLGMAGFASTVTAGGLELAYPLYRSRATNLRIRGGVELNDANIKLKQSDGAYMRLSESHLRILHASAQASHADRLMGVTQVDVALDRGVKGLGATPVDSDLSPRPDSRPDFTRASLLLSRRQEILGDTGFALDLVTSVGGVYGFVVLPPSQKAQLGGASFGRGYYFGQLTGDRAFQASVELAGNMPLRGLLPGTTVGPYLFYDYGTVWDIAQDDPKRRFLHSVGAGVRLALGQRLSLDLEYARRLITNPSRSNDAPLKPDQVLVRLVGRF